MVDEMAKLESRRLFSLDVDKWGSCTCYDDVSGDPLVPALVQEARALEIDYLTRMKVYAVVRRKEMKRSG